MYTCTVNTYLYREHSIRLCIQYFVMVKVNAYSCLWLMIVIFNKNNITSSVWNARVQETLISYSRMNTFSNLSSRKLLAICSISCPLITYRAQIPRLITAYRLITSQGTVWQILLGNCVRFCNAR